MHIAKESIFKSAVRSFFNTLLGMIGIIIGVVIILAISFSFSSPYTNSDRSIAADIMPDQHGNTELLSETSNVILRLDITGIIGDRDLYGELVEGYLRSSRTGVFKNDRVKGIILYINSPGGSAVDSDVIYRALIRYKEKYKIPIFAYSPGLMASGGYYIACAADKINCSPVAICGSVGVKIGPFFNFWDFMQKYGINSVTLTEGKYKEKYPSFSKISDESDKSAPYQDLIVATSDMYKIFVGIVTNARGENGLTEKLLIDQYGAQVFAGGMAQTYGYVDNGSTSYQDTLVELVKEANLDQTPYQVIRLYHKRAPIQDLMTGQLDIWNQKINEVLFGISSPKRWDNQMLFYYDAKDHIQ